MLFLLAIELLFRLFNKAQELGLLDRVSKYCERFRVSLYADADAMFIKSTPHNLHVSVAILNLFAKASGLVTNMDKTSFYPIQYQHTNLDFLSQSDLSVSSFPCTYLGLSLHFKKLSKELFQVLIQKKILSYPGREMLVKSVLSAMPTFLLYVFKMVK
jgi:hypothetical protein